MLKKKIHKRKLLTPAEEDKPIMLEMLALIILAVLCICVLVYVVIKFFLPYLESGSGGFPF